MYMCLWECTYCTVLYHLKSGIFDPDLLGVKSYKKGGEVEPVWPQFGKVFSEALLFVKKKDR